MRLGHFRGFLLACQLNRVHGHPTPPLRSGSITDLSPLLRMGLPLCPASVLSPRGFFPLVLLPFPNRVIGTTGSRSSARKPGPDSRLLYTGRHPPNDPDYRRTCPRRERRPWFRRHLRVFRCVHGGSWWFAFPIRTCPGYRPGLLARRSRPRLLNAAARDGLKPTSGSRLRGACPHLSRSLAAEKLIPSGAPAAHSFRTPLRRIGI